MVSEYHVVFEIEFSYEQQNKHNWANNHNLCIFVYGKRIFVSLSSFSLFRESALLSVYLTGDIFIQVFIA